MNSVLQLCFIITLICIATCLKRNYILITLVFWVKGYVTLGYSLVILIFRILFVVGYILGEICGFSDSFGLCRFIFYLSLVFQTFCLYYLLILLLVCNLILLNCFHIILWHCLFTVAFFCLFFLTQPIVLIGLHIL